jgi:hypothetical protein
MIQVRSRGYAVAGLLVLLLGTAGVAAAPSASAGSGADMAAGVSGPRTVRLGADITYTITGTNVGDQTAASVQLTGMYEDWFNPVGMDCRAGTVNPDSGFTCDFGDVAPGETVSMTLTFNACCPEKHMFQYVWVAAANDLNPDNDHATVKLNFRGPKH